MILIHRTHLFSGKRFQFNHFDIIPITFFVPYCIFQCIPPSEQCIPSSKKEPEKLNIRNTWTICQATQVLPQKATCSLPTALFQPTNYKFQAAWSFVRTSCIDRAYLYDFSLLIVPIESQLFCKFSIIRKIKDAKIYLFIAFERRCALD